MMPHQNTIETLERLIEFESISRNSNLDIADYVAVFVLSRGGRVERFRSPDGNKEALLLAFGPSVAGGIVLSGHMDVVPVDDQVWASDPFHLRQIDDRLYGRGAVDMKSFLAIAISTAVSLEHDRLSKPLYLAFSYDEETTCDGVKPIVAHLRDFVPPPAMVVVGEPTEMRVVAAHKGAADWRVRIRGRAAHSSLPHLGANAIHAGARIIGLVEQIGRDFRSARSPMADLYDVPYPTISVGMIKGGTAGNVIPSECQLHVEARTLEAGQDKYAAERILAFANDDVLPYLKETASDAEITVSLLDAIPPLVRHQANAAELLVGRLRGSNEVEAVSYATEAGFFQSIGLPTVVFGPGSIGQAHQPDEYITLSQVREGEAFFRELAHTLY